MKSKKLLIMLICVGIAATVIIGGIGLYLKKLSRPSDLFEISKPTQALKPSQGISDIERPAGTDEALPTPSPTIDPYEELMSQADLSMMKDIVNVLIMGVDYAEERETWNGKHSYHTDVMMILAINFEDKKVDMISLPRDTYANIPGIDGIYKLNAAIDCGGGYPTDEGFQKVCEAAEWMLGGIPVDYYYAVTMPAVKELVNAVGGVDYDLELDFKLAGRTYKKGMQHMDGQAVLDYLRVRKDIGSAGGDANRVNRQKKMLVALYNKMKKENILVKIPDMLAAFDGQLHTNTTFSQTAALALFAMDLNSESIGMHSMVGPTIDIFGWNFCITNQKKRVQLIEEVYGIKVKKYDEYDKPYAQWRWQDMLTPYYLEITKERIAEMAKLIEADKKLVDPFATPSAEPIPSASAPATAPPPTASASEAPVTTPPEETEENGWNWDFPWGDNKLGAKEENLNLVHALAGETMPGIQYRKYTQEVYDMYDQLLLAMKEMDEAQKEASKKDKSKVNPERLTLANQTFRELFDKLCDAFGMKRFKDEKWVYQYWIDKKFNEVKVDFR